MPAGFLDLGISKVADGCLSSPLSPLLSTVPYDLGPAWNLRFLGEECGARSRDAFGLPLKSECCWEGKGISTCPFTFTASRKITPGLCSLPWLENRQNCAVHINIVHLSLWTLLQGICVFEGSFNFLLALKSGLFGSKVSFLMTYQVWLLVIAAYSSVNKHFCVGNEKQFHGPNSSPRHFNAETYLSEVEK